jgi:exopolysaccharide production protein ExoQ
MQSFELSILSTSIIVLLLLITFLLILFLVVFHSNKNKKLSQFFEKIFIVFLLFCSGHIGFTPFAHWNLEYIIVPPIRSYIAQLQFPIYFCMALITASRLRWFITGEAVRKLKRAAILDPFIWMLVCMSIISAYWSVSSDVTFKGGAVLFGINLILTYIASTYSWKDLFELIRWTLALFAFFSIFIHNYGNGEFSGIFFSKNNLGNYMSLGITLWYLQAIYEPKKRLFASGIVVLCAVMLLLTKSGGAIFTFLTLILMSIVTLFVKRLKYRSAVIFLMLFISISLTVGFLVETNLETVFGAVGKDVTLTGRTLLWSEVWREIQNHFWEGHGVYSFWQPWKGGSNPAATAIFDSYRRWQPAQAHQGFLDLWLSSGLIGLTFFAVSFLISLSRSIYYIIISPKYISVLPAIFLVYIIMSNTTESQLLGTHFVWILYVLTSIKLCLSQD